ncbi:MAG: hypothetical protein OEX12_01070 [Gammaproteobacteria bacterium]|nr:hypothetical protein [Gammaproteobacteria bacterium]
MAYSLDNLALIAGSNGTSGRVWKYKEAATLAAIRASGYFNDAVDAGMVDGDVVMILGSDGFGFSQIAVSGSTYTVGEGLTSA